MIYTLNQAVEVQKRRMAQGKRGYAKAVRRFAIRWGSGWTDHKAAMARHIPALW